MAANCALLSPLHIATPAANMIANKTDGPAIPAPMPRLTNTPVPIMEPNPIIIAPGRPMTRLSCGC